MDQRIEILKGSNEVNQLYCGIHAQDADMIITQQSSLVHGGKITTLYKVEFYGSPNRFCSEARIAWDYCKPYL
jgi:hypothetical protein